MGKLGKATAYIELYEKLDKVVLRPNFLNFDLVGSQFQQMVVKSGEKRPQGIEFIQDGDWSCMMLAKFKTEIDNYLKIGEQDGDVGIEQVEDQRNKTRFEWSVNNVSDLLTTDKSNNYDFWKMKLRTAAVTSSKATQTVQPAQVSLVKPRWKTSSQPKRKNKIRGTSSSVTGVISRTSAIDTVWKIEQFELDASILWGAQTHLNFGSAPYFIEVSTAERQSRKDGLSDFILIRINNNNVDVIDILCQDSKIYIADWFKKTYYDKDMNVAKEQGNKTDFVTTGPEIIDTGLRYSSGTSAIISLGFLPCAGRLVIFSGDSQQYVYKRFGTTSKSVAVASTKAQLALGKNEPSDFVPFIFKTDTINVFASNCKGTVSISAMEFETYGLAIPQIYGAYLNSKADDRNIPFGISTGKEIIDLNKKYPRYYLFRGEDGLDVTGVSCNKWGEDDVTEYVKKLTNIHDPPRGTVFVTWENSYEKDHKNWKVMWIRMFPEKLKKRKGSKSDFYLDDSKDDTPEGFVAPEDASGLLSGTPFVYRLRGNFNGTTATEDVNKKILTSYNIVSLNHKYESQEIYSASQSVDVTLYYDESLRKTLNLEKKSYGIKIYLDWQEKEEVIKAPFFTGVTLDTSISEVAGKETITIHCEDYMRILADNLILNSPFYDGQEWFESLKDLATYAGISSVIDDTSNETIRYFLPSGYSFQDPKMKFPPTQPIKDCMTDIVKLCEKVFYFNAIGELHCDNLQGGLFFSGATVVVPDDFKFYRDPEKDDDNIIVDEKKSEKLISQTVNKIYVVSIDRMSGQPLQVSHQAELEMPEEWSKIVDRKISYKKITTGVTPPYQKALFLDQNAFGNLRATLNWIVMMAERVYKVPTRINFKTITTKIVPPLTYILVDGYKFRTTGYDRNYNAEDNSIITTISATWLGAADSQKQT